MSEKAFIDDQGFQELDSNLASREVIKGPTGQDGTAQLAGQISKEDILRRIEEDRERHKRLRESLWVIPNHDADWEFNHAWENTSDLCDDDFEVIREEMALYKQCHTA